MLNKFIGIGYVGKNGVELRYTPAGKGVATFSLGMMRPFKNQDGNNEWDNLNVVIWGKSAENCANFLQEKSMVAVEGRIQVRSYDGQDGNKRWITELVAENVRFLSPKGSGNNLNSISTDATEDELPECPF